MSLGAKPQQQVSEVPMGSPEEYPRQDGLWPTLTKYVGCHSHVIGLIPV